MLNSSYDLVFQKRLGLVCSLGFLLLIFTGGSLLLRDEGWWSNLWADLFWTGAGLACALRCFKTSRRAIVPSLAKAWFYFGLGSSFWTLGMLWWSWRQLVDLVVVPFPEISTVAFLSLVPCLVAGLFHYGWEQPRKSLTLLHVAEFGVSLCLISIVSVALFYRVVDEFEGELLYLTSALAYPFLYFASLLFASLKFWAPWPVNKRPFTLFLLGLASLAGVNIAYSYSLLHYLYFPGRLIDIFWVMGFFFIYWAAFEEEIGMELRTPRRSEKMLRPHLVRTLLPGIALFCLAASAYTFKADLGDRNSFLLHVSWLLALFMGFREWSYQSVQFELRRELREELHKTDAILKQMPTGLLIADAHSGEILRYNDAANKILLGNLSHITNIKEYSEVFRGFHADGRELTHDEWPLSRSIKNGETVEASPIDMVVGNGEKVTVLVSSSPIFAGDGSVSCCVAGLVDVSEMRKIEIERENLYLEAKNISRMRENFLMVASHELKTPLTPLKLRLQYFEQLLRRERLREIPGALLKKNLDSALEQVKRLENLVHDMLNISEIDAGKISLFPAATDLVALAGEVIQRLEPEIAARHTQIAGPIPAKVFAWVDRLKTDQVISNLISNALKYGSGKPIEVNVWEEGGRAMISVRDYGIGVGVNDQERIFGRFERAASEAHYGGFGLGLFIARSIVEAQGGHIQVNSEPGQGSTFLVDLPLAAEKSNMATGS